MALPSLNPFQRTSPALSASPILRGWEDMHKEMDRIFDNVFGDVFSAAPLAPAGYGANLMALDLDVAETDKAYVITADLPGLEEKDIDLSVADGVLTLKGEKRQEEETKGKTFHRIERSYGSFKRTLQLPDNADENAVNATMKNGVLKIEVGKSARSEPSARKIAIKAN